MSNIPMFCRSRFHALRIIPALFSLLLLVCATAPSYAADPFELIINRDFSQLPGQTPKPVPMWGSDISTQNNRPFVYFKNTSAQAITDFNMGIGNDLFH